MNDLRRVGKTAEFGGIFSREGKGKFFAQQEGVKRGREKGKTNLGKRLEGCFHFREGGGRGFLKFEGRERGRRQWVDGCLFRSKDLDLT